MDSIRTGLAALALALAACGSDGKTSTPDAPRAAADAPAAAPDAPATPDAAVAMPDAKPGSSLTLQVPASYSGAPRELAIIGVKKLPVGGPPDAVFLVDDKPAPAAGQAMALTLDTSAAMGDLYVVAVLYQQGGGQFTPKSGVDYVAQSAQTFHFTGAPIALGTLTLTLAP
jgi:hypothetical protein